MFNPLPSVVINEPRGQLLLRKRRPLQGRTFRVFNNIARKYSWDLIVDVGANYGEMIFYSSIPKDADIVVIEPNKPIFECLRRNLKEFINVTFLNVAVGPITSVAFLDTTKGHSGRVGLSSEPTQTQIQVSNFAEIVNAYESEKVLVKLDIEGGEFEIVRLTTKQSNSQIYWVVETHNFTSEEFSHLLSDYLVFDIDSPFERVKMVSSGSLHRYIKDTKKRGRNCLLVPKKSPWSLTEVKKFRSLIWFLIEFVAGFLYKMGLRGILVGPKFRANFK